MSKKWQSAIDLSKVVAIDVHTHAEVSQRGQASLSDELAQASSDYFKVEGNRKPTIPEMAAYYRERNMAAVIFTVDAETATGQPPVPNDEVAEVCADNSDVLIPFASVDPWKGKTAIRDARKLVEDYGVRGFKFHPNIQAFSPDDRMAYPLYETIEGLGVPALFHTGQTGIGAGVPGGGGIRLKYGNPMLIDDVAVDFPNLKIVLAHPSFPWQEEALAVATHKHQVYIDLSGWSPKYFPPILVQYANSLLKKRVLFGSDYPVLTPDRWLKDFEKLAMKPEVLPMIMKENAAALLGLS